MADIDNVVERVIDQYWKLYDKGKSGLLEKRETRSLMEAAFGELYN